MAGDICPDFSQIGTIQSIVEQSKWLHRDFKDWAEDIGVPIIATWGNHDFIGEHPRLVPEISNVTWLVDELRVEGDLRIWGTPHVPNLTRWAFYASEAGLQARAELIPNDLDVLMTHGPPWMVGDWVPHGPDGGVHVGDSSLNDAIRTKQPRVTICGHIHESRGDWALYSEFGKKLPVLNVAAVDVFYDLNPQAWKRLDL